MRIWDLVDLSEINEVWPFILHYVEKACEIDRNKYSPNNFLDLLLTDKAQLWLGKMDGITEAAALTDVLQFPNKKYARVIMGMGINPHDIDAFIEGFESWSRAIGCDGVISDVRLGLTPSFSKAGWDKTHILMEKEF